MKVEIEVPDGIVEFLKFLRIDPQKYAQEQVLYSFKADFDTFHIGPEIFIDLDELIQKYGLTDYIITYEERIKES